jgi:hypothetical protein
MINWKVFGSKRWWPKYSHGETENNHENPSKNIRSPGPDLNPGPSQYEAVMLALSYDVLLTLLSDNSLHDTLIYFMFACHQVKLDFVYVSAV